MSEIKPKIVYKQKLDEPYKDGYDKADKSQEEDLTAHQRFDAQAKFVPEPAQPEENRTEQELESIIRPERKKSRLVGGILTAFSGLVGWQTVDSVLNAIQGGDWLTIGWSAFIASLAGLGIGAIGRELWKLRKLRRHFSVQEKGEALIASDSVGQGEAFCQKLAKESHIVEEHPGFERWKNSIQGAHNDSEILQMYEGMVLSQQDKQAKELIARFSSEAALLVAVSPLAIADMLLVAWRNFKLIDRLAGIYGVELGYWSRIRLFRLVLLNMALAGASEVAIDAGINLLSVDLAGKVSTRVAQGFGIGILTARVGIKAQSLLRPIPVNKENQLRLGEIRKQLITTLKARI
ncbi:TIGR01620 family protein [Vibrio albus]|uniref:TIGR01620 family protein n=1 Tax=Vibrio albus TaxID=2200953 RepID=A0A2U3BDA8_9VIBR|nr:TIGR01620 family protein [Vibrio albus]PWI34771.1 TIGR01620 family protein [Vibrio albus]